VLRKYPVPNADVDLSGVVKEQTLEYFLLNPGWHRTVEIRRDSYLTDIVSPEESRAIQMRLVRYTRQGLLERRKRTNGFEYQISMKGEDRLFYLWDKFGETRVDSNLTEQERLTSEKLNDLKLTVLKRRLRILS
jgi:hypothetical protein